MLSYSQIARCYVFDASPTLSKINSYMLTKEEAKNELDQINHFRKLTFSKSEHDYYSVCVDVSKIAINSRTDIPKQRVYIPHQDTFGRVFYVQKFIW